MNTTRTPSAPPPDTAAGGGLRLRWRQVAADVADLVVVVLAGAVVAGSAYGLLSGPPEQQEGLAGLGFFLAMLMFGRVVAGVAAVVVLTMAWRSRSPGDRLLNIARDGDGGLGAAAAKLGRAVTVQASAAGLLASWDKLDEPDLLAPAAAAGLAAVAVGLFVVVYAQRRSSVGWQRFAVVAVAVGLLAGAAALGTPDRALYSWEVRAHVTELLPQTIEELGGRRVCARHGVPAGPSASHTTEACYDPDEVWAMPDPAEAATRRIVDRHRSNIGPDVDVTVGVGETLVGNDPAWEVVVDGRAEAYVANTPCGTRVRTSGYGNYPLRMGPFLPDVELADRCV